MKIIKVKTCAVCPFRAVHEKHDGISNLPYCNNNGLILSYVEARKALKSTAAATNIIPDWCPLEDEVNE